MPGLVKQKKTSVHMFVNLVWN